MRVVARVTLAVAIMWMSWTTAVLAEDGRAADGWRAVVRLHADAFVVGPDILLGEIADIVTDDTGLAERLESLVVGRAPLPGQRRELHAATVRTRMRQQRLPVGQILLATERPEIAVRTRSITVAGERLVAAARETLLDTIESSPAVGEDGVVELQCSVPDPLIVAAEDVALRVSRTSGAVPGVLIAMVDIEVDGVAARTVPVRCDAVLERDVLVATASLKRHDVLTADAYVVERRRLVSLPRDGFLSGDGGGRWRVTRPVSPGTVLTRGMVEPVPVVQRGDRVNIIASTGGVVVTAPGIALHDGGIDELIRVENVLSGHTVDGYVIDEETVVALMP